MNQNTQEKPLSDNAVAFQTGYIKGLAEGAREERERIKKIIEPIQMLKLSKGWVLSLFAPESEAK